jgi:monofunctional biosynthetic peptidoglycan transglycosylase
MHHRNEPSIEVRIIPMLKKAMLYTVLAVMLIIVANITVCFVYPDVSKLKKHNPKKTAFMEYREKQWADEGIKKKIVQHWVPLKGISPYLVKAVIIAEDDKFWRHEGFDFEAMQKALEKDIQKRRFKAGGSTISQQLAKNIYLAPSKSPIRKIKEAILTWRLERALSKKRIVELYLNVAEWGDGQFGIEAAARHYYGKRASALSAEEAAQLATVLPNPTRLKPIGESRYVRNRAARIYRIMVLRGIVIPEYEEVMNAPEEKTEEVIPESLAGQENTSGPLPPSGEESQKNTVGDSTQMIQNPHPPDTTAPGTDGQVEPAPNPAEGLENQQGE